MLKNSRPDTKKGFQKKCMMSGRYYLVNVYCPIVYNIHGPTYSPKFDSTTKVFGRDFWSVREPFVNYLYVFVYCLRKTNWNHAPAPHMYIKISLVQTSKNIVTSADWTLYPSKWFMWLVCWPSLSNWRAAYLCREADLHQREKLMLPADCFIFNWPFIIPPCSTWAAAVVGQSRQMSL